MTNTVIIIPTPQGGLIIQLSKIAIFVLTTLCQVTSVYAKYIIGNRTVHTIYTHTHTHTHTHTCTHHIRHSLLADSDACSHLVPCKNNGTCLNNDTSDTAYICYCPLGYGGTECSETVSGSCMRALEQ